MHTRDMATNDSETVLTGAAASAVYVGLWAQMINGMAGGEPNGTAAYGAVYTTLVKSVSLAAYPPRTL